MIKRLSFVLRLTDSFFCGRLSDRDAELWIDGEKRRHEYKRGGYFAVADLSEGSHFVTVRSRFFQSESITVNVDYSQAFSFGSRVYCLDLNPSASHPNAARYPSVRGRAVGAQRLYIVRPKGKMKIAQDGADSGKTALRLFCEGKRPRLPAFFWIRGGADDCGEIVTVVGADGDIYTLEEPLRFSHCRSSPVVSLIRLACGENGEFFFAIPPEFCAGKDGEKIRLGVFAECGGTLTRAEFAAERSGCTRLGEIMRNDTRGTKNRDSL